MLIHFSFFVLQHLLHGLLWQWHGLELPAPDLLMWPSALEVVDVWAWSHVPRTQHGTCWEQDAQCWLWSERSETCGPWGCRFCSGFQLKTWLKSPDVFAEMFPQLIRRKLISRTHFLMGWAISCNAFGGISSHLIAPRTLFVPQIFDYWFRTTYSVCFIGNPQYSQEAF